MIGCRSRQQLHPGLRYSWSFRHGRKIAKLRATRNDAFSHFIRRVAMHSKLATANSQPFVALRFTFLLRPSLQGAGRDIQGGLVTDDTRDDTS